MKNKESSTPFDFILMIICISFLIFSALTGAVYTKFSGGRYDNK